MQYSIINVSDRKPKTYEQLNRLQDYLEKNAKEAEPAAWKDAREYIRNNDARLDMYERYVAPAHARQEDDRLIITAPDQFTHLFLQKRFDSQIDYALNATGHSGLRVEYEIGGPPDAQGSRIIESRDDWAAYTEQRLGLHGITPRQGQQGDRYNSVLGIHYTLTASPAWFRDHPDQKDAWIKHSRGFIDNLHGEAQILGVFVHEHQQTTHLHIVAVPINEQGKLSARSFTGTPEQVEALQTEYNRYLREHGLQLERGTNYRLDRAMATASPEMRARSLYADDIPLDDVLTGLEAEHDGRDPRRWFIGDRIIQVHGDSHGFTEMGPHGANDGHGAIDLVQRLRQEGATLLEQHDLAVDYLAITHPEHIPGGAPPLVPQEPEPAPRQPLDRQSMAFGQESRWEPGQFLIVDSMQEAVIAMGKAKGWGRIAVADGPNGLPVDEMDEAMAKGWMIDIASDNASLREAVQERYSDLDEEHDGQLWFSPAPSTAKAKGAEKAMVKDMEKGPDIGPEMLMEM